MKEITPKKLSECLAEILKLPVADDAEKQFLEENGVKKEDRTNRVMVMAKLVEKGRQGDIPAIREIRSIMQEAESKDDGMMADILKAVGKVE